MIDLDKILTVSANTFYESKGLNKKDYELVGVHTFGIMEPSASNNKVSPINQNLLKKFQKML